MGSPPGEGHVDATGLPIQSPLEDDVGVLGCVAVAVSTSDRVLSVRRDHDIIDSELRLLAAVRRSIREHGIEPSHREVDELLDERLAHRGWPGEDVAVDTYRRPVPHHAAHRARPGRMRTATGAARLVSDKHPARPEAMNAVSSARLAKVLSSCDRLDPQHGVAAAQVVTNPLSILSMSTGKDIRCDITARFLTLLRLHRRLGDRGVDTAAPPNVLPATSITGASSHRRPPRISGTCIFSICPMVEAVRCRDVSGALGAPTCHWS
jgi:hypothetical protein